MKLSSLFRYLTGRGKSTPVDAQQASTDDQGKLARAAADAAGQPSAEPVIEAAAGSPVTPSSAEVAEPSGASPPAAPGDARLHPAGPSMPLPPATPDASQPRPDASAVADTGQPGQSKPAASAVVDAPLTVQAAEAAPAENTQTRPRPEASGNAQTRPESRVPSRLTPVVTPFLARTDMALAFADPARQDQPLLYVNDAFCALTGYSREECVGRNCRFLQGELTRRSETQAIRQALDNETYLLTRLLNYRRDGSRFDNVLQVGQLRNKQGDIRLLFGLQWDISTTLDRTDSAAQADQRDRAMQARLRMLERLAHHLVRRSITLSDGAAGVPLLERLVAMTRPYQFPGLEPRPDRAGIRALCAHLLAPYGYRKGVNLVFNGAQGTFASEFAGALALWLHEMATRTRKTGKQTGRAGEVMLSWGFPTEQGRPMIAFNWNKSIVDESTATRHHRPFAASKPGSGPGAVLVRETVAIAGGRTSTQAWKSSLDGTLVLPNAGSQD